MDDALSIRDCRVDSLLMVLICSIDRAEERLLVDYSLIVRGW